MIPGAGRLAALTGYRDGPPDFSRTAVLAAAREVADAVDAGIDVPMLLTGRAALLGLTRRGQTSAGGATRMIAARDGWWAMTLSRAEDLDAVPALTGADDAGADPWARIRWWAAGQTAAEATARARLLDLPAATLGETAAAAPRIHRNWPVSKPRPGSRALVVDLTSMWAGPLCAQLLRQTGAVVVKVESPRRPDGTRAGNRAFFDWMNGGKLLCGTDFDSDTRRLHALLSVADVVLEGSRPAALARRGLGPYDVPARPGKVWVRITGHGADDAHAGLVAFGDDAAVSGGLVAGDTEPVFCGDAIADPLTGLEAARQVTASRARGGGELIEISMAAVAAHYAGLPRSLAEGPGTEEPLTQPEIPCSAGLLGADNAAVARIVAERQSVPC